MRLWNIILNRTGNIFYKIGAWGQEKIKLLITLCNSELWVK